MPVKNIKIATAILLMALECNSVCLTAQAFASDCPVLPMPKQAAEKPLGEIDEKMFPDGFAIDFGKVPRGMQVKHAFRIINTSNVPIQIVSVRHS